MYFWRLAIFSIKNDFGINDNGLISLYAEDNVKRQRAVMSFNISNSLMSTYSDSECVCESETCPKGGSVSACARVVF